MKRFLSAMAIGALAVAAFAQLNNPGGSDYNNQTVNPPFHDGDQSDPWGRTNRMMKGSTTNRTTSGSATNGPTLDLSSTNSAGGSLTNDTSGNATNDPGLHPRKSKIYHGN